MKSNLQGIQADLRDFIDRPSLFLLIVCCEIEHSALLLKSMDSLEQDTAAPEIKGYRTAACRLCPAARCGAPQSSYA